MYSVSVSLLNNLVKFQFILRRCIASFSCRFGCLVHQIRSLIVVFLLNDVGPMQTSVPVPAQTVLIALRESMMRRTTQSAIFPVWSLVILNWNCCGGCMLINNLKMCIFSSMDNFWFDHSIDVKWFKETSFIFFRCLRKYGPRIWALYVCLLPFQDVV